MKKCVSILLLFVFILTLSVPSFSAKKKKVIRKSRTKITRRVRKVSWPKGPKPVFPVEGKKPSKPVVPSLPAPLPVPVSTVPAVPAKVQTIPVKGAFLGGGGFGGGALLLNVGYQRPLTDKISYFGGVGYGIGNSYSVTVLDLGLLSYNLGDFSAGGGLTYAMYSAIVADILGIGQIPSKSLLGVELFAQKRFSNIVGRIGYNTALGIRISGSYEF